ncbi:MAG: ABC transporter ATP-binding protein, partial [Candidatus Thalassarchaeaceae archaeon]|nr:ABC transporter ATP-binding protein [Candidatus Thalassarchaeaceae archaeon]
LILFVPIIFIMPLIYFFSTRVQKKYRESRQSFGDINAVLSNNISGMGVVQAYNAETYEAERVGRESSSYKNHAIGATVQRTKFLPGIYVIAGLAFGLLATAGGYLMLQGQDSGGISPGQFVTFLLMSTRMSMPLFILGMLVNQIQKSEASARRVFAMVDLEPSIVDKENADALLKPADSISFNDVHFGYPNGNKVLNGVSFDLKRNQSVGIVGPTGAGKSTIVKLLLRYYETDNGIISMNDKDINDLKLGSIREQIGYVSQDVYLFHGTIRENIAYADQSAGNEAIENAASLAGANDFIESFPKGYDTIVGDRGVKLSGGQRQRISLARAILRQPPLLILDEATSAVDTRTEEIIQRNLNQFKDGRMTVAVAHRLSTIRDADQIIVLVDGVVVERGAHDDLISQQGVYADLWAVQTGELDNTTGEATQHDG